MEVSGKAGEVTYATGTVAGIKGWTLDYASDALETTDFGDSGRRTYISGLSGWSGSFEGNIDGIPKALGAEIALELKITQTDAQKYYGQAIITGSHPSVTVDGVAVISYDFQGTGELTVPTG